MSNEAPAAPIAPHEQLNQRLKEGPIDIDIQKIQDMSFPLFFEALKPFLAGDIGRISDGLLKQAALVSVNAAVILLKEIKNDGSTGKPK